MTYTTLIAMHSTFYPRVSETTNEVRNNELFFVKQIENEVRYTWPRLEDDLFV